MFQQTKSIPFAPLVSKRRMEVLLRCDRKILEQIAQHAGKHYKPFDMRRGSGKWRHIDNPSEALKGLQSRIYRAILADYEFLPNVIGGIPGRSIRDNVMPHLRQPVIVTFDIRGCFPSIHHRRVFTAFRDRLRFSEKVASVLTKLTTFQHRLPQGGPSSAIIANLVMVPLHEELDRIARAFDLRWTIYIDDITISGARAREAIEPVIRAIQRQGFAISHHKLHIMSRRSRQCVTGVIVNRTISAGRRYRFDEIRHSILKLHDAESVTGRDIRSIAGKVNNVRWLNRRQGDALQRFADALLPRQTCDDSSPQSSVEWRPCRSFSRSHEAS